MLPRVRQWFTSRVPQLSPREAYRLWAEHYPPYAHNLLMEVEERAMCELLPAVRNQAILDLAAGTGRYTRLLTERGAHVTALDFSYEMLERGENHVARVQADMNALPLCDSFAGVIICGLAVGHVRDLSLAVREMARVLTHGGTLLYSDFHAAGEKYGWRRTFRAANKTFAVQHYSRAEPEHVRALAAAGFQIETMRAVTITAELARADARAENFRATWGDTPVVLVVRAQKP